VLFEILGKTSPDQSDFQAAITYNNERKPKGISVQIESHRSMDGTLAPSGLHNSDSSPNQWSDTGTGLAAHSRTRPHSISVSLNTNGTDMTLKGSEDVKID